MAARSRAMLYVVLCATLWVAVSSSLSSAPTVDGCDSTTSVHRPQPRATGHGGFTDPSEFYVSPTGDDNGDGSLASPFRTPFRALNATRQLARPLLSDIHVYFRSGLYTLTSPLTLLPGDGGDGSGARMLWGRAAGDTEPVVLSGGATLSGWTAAPGLPGVVRTALPAGLPLDRSRQLFVGGQRRELARVPAVVPSSAGGWSDVYSDASTMHYVSSLSGCGFHPAECYPASCPSTDALGFVYNTSDARGPSPDWLTQGGAVDILTFGSWTAGYATLAAIVPTNATLLTAAPLPSSPGKFGGLGCPSGARWVAFNVFSALVPGSGTFYVDDAERVVYYALRSGETAETLVAIMPMLDTLLVVAGDDCGGPVAWTAFTDLNFSYTTDGGERLTSGRASHGAIEVSSALNLNLTRVSISHVGGNGIHLGGFMRNVAIDSCDVRDAGGDGFSASAGTTDTSIDTSITNSVVESIGHIFLEQPAGMRIMGSGAEGTTTVAHNLVRDTPYAGIAVGWHAGAARPTAPVAPRYIIQANLVEDIGNFVLNDFGGIYVSMGSPGYVCQDTDECWIPTLIDSNLVRRVYAYNWGGAGAYTDENVAGVVLANNVFASVSFAAICEYVMYEMQRRSVCAVALAVPTLRAPVPRCLGVPTMCLPHFALAPGPLTTDFHCGFNLSATNNILWGGHAQLHGQTALMGSCNTGGVQPHETNITASLHANIFVVVGPTSTLFDASDITPIADTAFDSNVYWAAPPLNASTLRFPATRTGGAPSTFAQWQAAGEDVRSAVADPLVARASSDNDANWTLLPASPALARGFRQIDLTTVGPRRW